MGSWTWSTKLLFTTVLCILTGCAHTTDFANDEVTNLRGRLELQELKLAHLEETINKLADAASYNGRADPLPRSCFEALTSNPSMESGTYDIDPDGSNVGDDPFSVYCDVATGTTLISHDSEDKTATESCTGPGCYEKIVDYTASVKQMRALIDISKECRQLVEVECMESPFEYDQSQYSYWKDVNGLEQYFWAGNKGELHTCQCGIDGNCQIEENVARLPDIRCNCDYNLVAPQIDSGYITDKVSLPVMQLYFGKYQRKNSYSAYTLGKLECSGKEEVTKDKMPTNCEELALIGHSLNGFYGVKGTGKRDIEMVYCDFNLAPNTEGFERRRGFVEVYKEEITNPANCDDLKHNGHTVNGLYSVKGTEKIKTETIYCNFDLASDNQDFENRLGFVQAFQEIYDNPSSCYELKVNGHSLNGLYLVKGTGRKKIETIYCNFDLFVNNPGFEKRIGFVQVHTVEKGIYFYVQRNDDFKKENKRIPFDVTISNNGDGMDTKKGLFTAPKAGRYFFSFTGVKIGDRATDGHVEVSLRKNGATIGCGAGATHEVGVFSVVTNEFDYTFSLQATLDLAMGDTIDVFLNKGQIKGKHFLHFNGFLVNEDLQL